MKLHATRYGLTAAFGTIASCMAIVALKEFPNGILFGITIAMALFVGILSAAVIPYDDMGDK